MLPELLQALATPCPKHIRSLGYITELVSIRSRYLRCRTSWRPHLDKTRAALMKSAEAAPSKRTALILGSGWLLDVPIKELSKCFNRVVLVDIAHPLPVRWEIRKFKNVDYINDDVSGVTQFVQAMIKNDAKELPVPLLQEFKKYDDEIDWIASVNLLSQLPLLPSAAIESRFQALELDAWTDQIQRMHVKSIEHSAPSWIVVSDVEEIEWKRSLVRAQANAEVNDPTAVAGAESASLVGNVFNRNHQCEWWWELIPRGESNRGSRCWRRVRVWLNSA